MLARTVDETSKAECCPPKLGVRRKTVQRTLLRLLIPIAGLSLSMNSPAAAQHNPGKTPPQAKISRSPDFILEYRFGRRDAGIIFELRGLDAPFPLQIRRVDYTPNLLQIRSDKRMTLSAAITEQIRSLIRESNFSSLAAVSVDNATTAPTDTFRVILRTPEKSTNVFGNVEDAPSPVKRLITVLLPISPQENNVSPETAGYVRGEPISKERLAALKSRGQARFFLYNSLSPSTRNALRNIASAFHLIPLRSASLADLQAKALIGQSVFVSDVPLPNGTKAAFQMILFRRAVTGE